MNPSRDKADREVKLPKSRMKQEEMEQKFAKMTTGDDRLTRLRPPQQSESRTQSTALNISVHETLYRR